MKVPENHAQFYEKTISESLKLINHGMWEISLPKFEAWTQQFLTIEEKFFSACILDSLIFRTNAQFESCLKSIFRGNLNNTIYKDRHDGALLIDLKSWSTCDIKIVPVICETDPPTKSGPLVLRRLQRILGINSKKMCWPWQAHTEKKQTAIVIFVDDFLGTGEQFIRFFNQWGFNEKLDGTTYYYVPAVAHQDGIDNIQQNHPQIIISTAEKLDKNNNFFTEENWSKLSGGQISASEAKDWYSKFCEEKEITPKTTGIYGIGEMSLTYGFSHSTPNNSLPILWYGNGSWQGLLER